MSMNRASLPISEGKAIRKKSWRFKSFELMIMVKYLAGLGIPSRKVLGG
jgi:hypothetical protein